MIRHKRLTLAFPLIALGLIGCGGALPAPHLPKPPSLPSTVTKLSVNPPSITVSAGFTATFMGAFAPTAPAGGSLTWSINPVYGGTISGTGFYTASAMPGQYSIIATWTPQNSTTAVIIKGSAIVRILAVPQLDSVISPDLAQASGANQSAGSIQIAAIVGQGIPAVLSTDSSGNIQVLSAFTIPTQCDSSTAACQ